MTTAFFLLLAITIPGVLWLWEIIRRLQSRNDRLRTSLVDLAAAKERLAADLDTVIADRDRQSAAKDAYREMTALVQRSLDDCIALVKRTEQDANQLAACVARYVKEMDDMAAKMGDPKPPQLAEERAALAFHTEPTILNTLAKNESP